MSALNIDFHAKTRNFLLNILKYFFPSYRKNFLWTQKRVPITNQPRYMNHQCSELLKTYCIMEVP